MGYASFWCFCCGKDCSVRMGNDMDKRSGTRGDSMKLHDQSLDHDDGIRKMATLDGAYRRVETVKMEGYLEKRGRLLVPTWKRYWFVLDGRLLLYYKSKVEYLNLSPCRGSLNMGLVSSVRPVRSTGGHQLEVVTRSQVVNLRARDRRLQEEWLKALLDAMSLPNISSPVRTSGSLYFRYSMGTLPTTDEAAAEIKKMPVTGSATLPLPENQSDIRASERKPPARRESMLIRIKKLGGQSYGSLDNILGNLRKGNGNRPKKNDQSNGGESPETLEAPEEQQQPLKFSPKLPTNKTVDKLVGSHVDNNGENTLCTSSETKNNREPELEDHHLAAMVQNGCSKSSESFLSYIDIDEASFQTDSSGGAVVADVLVENEHYEGGIKPNQEQDDGTKDENLDVSKTDQDDKPEPEMSEEIPKLTTHEEHRGPAEYDSQQKSLTFLPEDEEVYEDIKFNSAKLTKKEDTDDPPYEEYRYDEVKFNPSGEATKEGEPDLPPRPTSELTKSKKVKSKDKKKQKESQPSTEESKDNNRGQLKKRKMSFLRKMLGHKIKKDAKDDSHEPLKQKDSKSEDSEVEYETVDYSAIPDGEGGAKASAAGSETPLFGSKTLLAPNTMKELKEKLKEKQQRNASDNADKIVRISVTQEETEVKQDSDLSEDVQKLVTVITVPSDLSDMNITKSPVPTPRQSRKELNTSSELTQSSTNTGKLTNFAEDEAKVRTEDEKKPLEKSRDSINSNEFKVLEKRYSSHDDNTLLKLLLSDDDSETDKRSSLGSRSSIDYQNQFLIPSNVKPPKLPPRHNLRPPSPSHDVPRNNSPVYRTPEEREQMEAAFLAGTTKSREVQQENLDDISYINFREISAILSKRQSGCSENGGCCVHSIISDTTDEEFGRRISQVPTEASSDAEGPKRSSLASSVQSESSRESRHEEGGTLGTTDDLADKQESEEGGAKNSQKPDELNMLLSELSEITMSPLLPRPQNIHLRNESLQENQVTFNSFQKENDSMLPAEQEEVNQIFQPKDIPMSSGPDSILITEPIRHRRKSDPDYDIPRPHHSIAVRPPSNDSDEAIEATYFFGPVNLFDDVFPTVPAPIHTQREKPKNEVPSDNKTNVTEQHINDDTQEPTNDYPSSKAYAIIPDSLEDNTCNQSPTLDSLEHSTDEDSKSKVTEDKTESKEPEIAKDDIPMSEMDVQNVQDSAEKSEEVKIITFSDLRKNSLQTVELVHADRVWITDDDLNEEVDETDKHRAEQIMIFDDDEDDNVDENNVPTEPSSLELHTEGQNIPLEGQENSLAAEDEECRKNNVQDGVDAGENATVNTKETETKDLYPTDSKGMAENLPHINEESTERVCLTDSQATVHTESCVANFTTTNCDYTMDDEHAYENLEHTYVNLEEMSDEDETIPGSTSVLQEIPAQESTPSPPNQPCQGDIEEDEEKRIYVNVDCWEEMLEECQKEIEEDNTVQLRQKKSTNDESVRLSFALTETVLVEEEVVAQMRASNEQLDQFQTMDQNEFSDPSSIQDKRMHTHDETDMLLCSRSTLMIPGTSDPKRPSQIPDITDLRNSGILDLQEFLASCDFPTMTKPSAVNKLGHSAAVSKLKEYISDEPSE